MGAGSAYYSGFTCLLFVFAGIYALISFKSVCKFLYAAYLCILVLCTSVITILPGIVASLAGNNSFYGTARANSDIDVGSMHIVSLFAPIYNHFIEPLGKFSENLNKALNNTQEKSLIFMGGIMAVGLIFSIYYMLYNYGKEDVICLCGKSNLFFLLISIVGGIDSIIAMYVTSSIRSYNRTVVYISFFSVLSIGILIDKGINKYKLKNSKKIIVYFIIFIIGFVGVLPKDYSSIWVEMPHYNEIEKQFNTEKQFVAEIENIMEENDEIFELPIVTEDDINVWPETEEQGAYNLYKPVINSKKTVWSHGGLINSRPYFWKKSLKELEIEELVPVLSAYGFKGIYIDTNGFEERKASEIINQMNAILGNPLVSSDEKLYFYDMRVYNKALYNLFTEKEIEKIRSSVYIWAEFQTGLIQKDINDLGFEIYTLNEKSKMVIGNISNSSINIKIKLKVVNGKKDSIVVECGEKKFNLTDLNNNGEFSLDLNILPGTNIVNFYSNDIIDIKFDINIA